MAREVGLEVDFDLKANEYMFRYSKDSLSRFAELVAKSEREAIAQLIEDSPLLVEFAQNDQGGCLMCGFTPKLAAQFIRARN